MTERFGHPRNEPTRSGEELITMLSKTAFGLAFILATASGSLAATKPHASAQATAAAHSVYSPTGTNLGWDPDPNVRLNLQRDWSHGRY
jgi:hypothetical protein